MINSLDHLPRPNADADTLAECFVDLAPPLNAHRVTLESAHCLYCYDVPCVNTYPTEIDIPGFVRNIVQGNIQSAAQKIPSMNILGGSCTRVYPTETLCQRVYICNNTQGCAPVLVSQLQRYALDHAGFGEHPFKRSSTIGKRTIVIDAGPAGLSCAHRLAIHGRNVVLFEARVKAGSLNEYGTTRYKLVDDLVQREMGLLLQAGGIELRHGQRFGDNLALGALHNEYDAAFPGIGLAVDGYLGLEDKDAPGLLIATGYIRELRQSDDLPDLPVADRCIVISAGNTVIDMAAQMSQLGARDVNLAYRRGFEEVGATGHEQGITRTSQVRPLTWARPGRVLLDEHGRVCGMRFARARLESGRLGDTGEYFELVADAIFEAIGQAFEGTSPDDPLIVQLRCDGERIQINRQIHTSTPGIYAGGDCVALGEDLTVRAAQHGKLMTEAIHTQLMLNVETT